MGNNRKANKPLKIGIYVEVLKIENKTGISRYVLSLIKNLAGLNDNQYTFYLYYQCVSGETVTLDLPELSHVIIRPIWSPIDLISERPRIWWKYYLPFYLWLDGIDVFHGPNHYVPLTGRFAKVVTIHDIAYFYMNVHGKNMDNILKEWTLKSVSAATKVCAISKSTANDLIEQGVPKEKIDIIYQGFERKKLKAAEEENSPESENNAPFILFVSTIQPRKNVIHLVKEFALIKEQIPHNLVLAGAPGSDTKKIETLIEENELQGRVKLTGFISDQKRHELYSNADIFVYPSLYEGFGLVVLEAMDYGIPVITSDNSSLPEAAGNAAILVDVQQPHKLGSAILELANTPHLRTDLIKKGFEHIESFDWKTSASRMLELYRDAYNEQVRTKRVIGFLSL